MALLRARLGTAMSTAPEFAVIDVETTGLEPGAHRVVECAIVCCDEAGGVVRSWSSLFAIPGDGELGASGIHGITRAMTTSAPTFSELAPCIIDELRGRVLIGHVVDFDLGHLAAEFRRAHIPVPPLGPLAVCTRRIVKARMPPGSRTLRSCCERLGLPYADGHSALGDALATAGLFAALRARFGDIEATPAYRAATEARWPVLPPATAGPWTRADASGAVAGTP